MSQRGLVLSFPLLKHQRQRSLWFVDQSCSYTAQQQLRTAVSRECPSVCQFPFDDCVFGTSVQKSASSSPYLACRLSETPDEAHLAPLLTLQQGQSLGQMLPYHLTEGVVWRMNVQQRGIIDQLQETESAYLGTFPREDDNYLKIMNSISSSVSLKLHSVEHSRCSPPAM